MTMTVLHSKDIYYVLKREVDGISELIQQFNFSDEEELFEVIKKVAPSKSKDFIKDLKKQRKNFYKRVKASDEGKQVVEENIAQEEFTPEIPEEIPTVEIETLETKSEEKIEITVESLEDLKKQEQELSALVCELEGKHKSYVAVRRDCLSNLELAKKALTELRRILKLQEDNVLKLYTEYEEAASAMHEINQEKNAQTQKLEAIRARIFELEKITIFVFSEGTIDVENADIPYVLEDQVMNKFNELIIRPETMEFSITAKQIKTIAKLLLMIEEFRKAHSTFEVEFDSKELQRFYETVVSK